MDPALLAADPPRALLEVGRVGLVAADLLGGDDEVELGAQVAARDAEQLVVDVGDDPDRRSACASRSIAAFASRNGMPVGDAVGQELGPRGLELPADLAGDLDRGAAQDLGVELVGAAHDLGLDLEEAVDELLLVEAEAVLGRPPWERVEDPLLPVDQGAVAVGGDPLDVFELGKWP